MPFRFSLLLSLFFASVPLCGLAQIEGGRVFDPERSFSIEASGGLMLDLSGSVVETSRLITRRTGISASNIPENYDLEELGFGDDYETFGLTLRKWWRYVSLQLDLNYVQPDATATAPRDFFIGVDDVAFGGRKFEHMVLPQGQRYDAELETLMAHLRLQFTPFTINPRGALNFTPWLHLGINAVVTDMEVNAGQARGVIQSENPPRDYVVGGRGTATNGGAIPEIGIGGQLRLDLGRGDYLVIEGTYAIMQFEGATDDIGISSRHSKVLDLDYTYLDVRAYLEIPLNEGLDLLLGASLEMTSAEATAEADDSQSTAQVLQRREKFDKDIELDYTIAKGFIGLRF